MEEYCGTVVKRMGASNGGLDPGNRDVEGAEERTRDANWEDGGAEVVQVTRESNLRTGAGTADLRVAFKDDGGNTCGREGDRGGKTVGAGADDCRCCHKSEKIDVKFLFLRCGKGARENSKFFDGVR